MSGCWSRTGIRTTQWRRGARRSRRARTTSTCWRWRWARAPTRTSCEGWCPIRSIATSSWSTDSTTSPASSREFATRYAKVGALLSIPTRDTDARVCLVVDINFAMKSYRFRNVVLWLGLTHFENVLLKLPIGMLLSSWLFMPVG